MTSFKVLIISISTIIISACSTKTEIKIENNDPLPSWNVGNTKKAIVEFVEEVTNEGSQDFIPIVDRIAVFDNDGNLWSEQPMYFQLFFAIDRVKTLSSKHPEWNDEQPFKAVLENDQDQIKTFGTKEILQLVMASHAGMTSEEFEKTVNDWITTAKHPIKNKAYTDLVYQPMLELLDYLRENDFSVFIVSGGGIDFMRPWAEQVYGITRQNIVGSSIKTSFEIEDGKPVIKRLAELDFIDDKEGKPIGIQKFIGRRPVFCSGNSDGDLAMMQWTAAGNGKRFMLYLHHTDSDREWAYDRKSHIGTFDKGLDEAIARKWTIIDMKEDWKVIYPFETH